MSVRRIETQHNTTICSRGYEKPRQRKKIARTRSLADFAKLVEIFDEKSVSFVAVTQQFNTTTSMGRLTLSVLLSFAQFERELSSERVRDKIAASRKKGKWTGGSVPLGYDSVDKKLVINEAEAKTVRMIFSRYLVLKSFQALIGELDEKGVVTKTRLPGSKIKGGVPFTYGPLAYLLKNRTYLGETGHTRLIINLPPRYLKSIMVSVAFPAFLLGHEPKRRAICISYGDDLSEKHASDFRAIVESSWYRAVFPKMQIRRIANSDVYTTSRGFRRTTSVNAALTGLGGDLFIVDDPQKPVDAQSDIKRDSLNQWFSNTLLSRLDNKATSAIIVVMQRVHLGDLSGELAGRSDNWTVLSLPAIAEEDQQIPIGPGQFYFRRAGEALHPEHESLATLEELRSEIGPDVFAAQYQQAPVPVGGAMIRRAWLSYYDNLPVRDYQSTIIQSWDTAAKIGIQNDWSVCTTWMLRNNHYYLMDVTRGRYEYPELKARASALAERFKPNVILVEDASAGTSLAQELVRELSTKVSAIPACHDKRVRLFVQQAKFASGRVLFPKGALFLRDLENELLMFPQGKTDDQVDSLSQALASGSNSIRFMWMSPCVAGKRSPNAMLSCRRPDEPSTKSQRLALLAFA